MLLKTKDYSCSGCIIWSQLDHLCFLNCRRRLKNQVKKNVPNALGHWSNPCYCMCIFSIFDGIDNRCSFASTILKGIFNGNDAHILLSSGPRNSMKFKRDRQRIHFNSILKQWISIFQQLLVFRRCLHLQPSLPFSFLNMEALSLLSDSW